MVLKFDEIEKGSYGFIDSEKVHQELIGLLKGDKVKLHGYDFDGKWLEVSMKVNQDKDE